MENAIVFGTGTRIDARRGAAMTTFGSALRRPRGAAIAVAKSGYPLGFAAFGAAIEPTPAPALDVISARTS